MIKLYRDPREVEREFRHALLRDFSMADELEQGDVCVSKMTSLPGDYTYEPLPWEGERGEDDEELTIGAVIDAGAAPEYTKLRDKLIAARASMKAAP